jgi:NAD(P)-dependent dehydrogenase (short-subunit alcohol dehydrogenase family)
MTTLPTTPSFSLAGRRALVTGGSSGIGLGCAVALAEAGAHVVIMARRREQLDEVVAAMMAAGHSVEAMVGDIADVEAMAASIESLRPLDIFVNSAGLARHSPVVDTDPADFDAVMNVNLRGAYFAAQAVARAMIEDDRPGSIMTISSQMAIVGGIDRACLLRVQTRCRGVHQGDGH